MQQFILMSFLDLSMKSWIEILIEKNILVW
jgi:hypothetical protein